MCAGIEGTNSELKRRHGLGRLRVRGGERVRLAVYLKALACNVKRMVRARLDEQLVPPRLPWRPLPPLHEATGAVASPLMPTRIGMARPNDLIGHNTSPDRNKPNPSPNRPHAAEPTRKALVTRESIIEFKFDASEDSLQYAALKAPGQG